MLKSNLHTFLLLSLVTAGNWLAATQLLPAIKTDIQAETAEDNWQLPKLSLSNSAFVSKARLEQLHPWGQPAQTEQTESTEEKAPEKPQYAWKLLGIVGEGKSKYALIINGANNKVARYQVGAELPDGAHLLEIQANSVGVQKNNTAEITQVQLHTPQS